jgi:hypothetical protein
MQLNENDPVFRMPGGLFNGHRIFPQAYRVQMRNWDTVIAILGMTAKT